MGEASERALRPEPPDTAGRILMGVARVLADVGMDGLTVAPILREANVSRRTFYQYFSSKEDVVHALFERATDVIIAQVRAAVRSEDPAEGMLEAADAYLGLWMASAPLSLVLQTEAMRAGSALAPVRRRTLDTLCADTAQRYEDATGTVIDPLVFRAMFLALEGLLAHAAEDPEVTPSRIRSVIEPLVRRLLREP